MELRFEEWEVLLRATLILLEGNVNSLAVQAYGFFMISGLVSIPTFSFPSAYLSHLSRALVTSLSTNWDKDSWMVLNCLLLVRSILQDIIEEDSNSLLIVIRERERATFEWEQLDQDRRAHV